MRLRNLTYNESDEEDTSEKMGPKSRAPATPRVSRRTSGKSSSKNDEVAATPQKEASKAVSNPRQTQSTPNVALGDAVDSEDDEDEVEDDLMREADDDHDVFDDYESEEYDDDDNDDDGTHLDRMQQPTAVAKDMHQLPNYPQELRLTRSYFGPLKKYDRGRALIEGFYGKDEEDLRIVYELRDVWINRPIVPAHGGAEIGGVMESPWFAKSEMPKLVQGMTRWWGGYQRSVPANQQQKTTVVVKGFDMLPKALADKNLPSGGGDILIMLGPKGRLGWHLFKQGLSKAIHWSGEPAERLRETGNHDGSPSAGWLSYYGGIPLSAEWAPLTGRVAQILAMAIIPPEDQVSRAVGDELSEEDMKHGCIQFIKHGFVEVDGRVFPSDNAPVLQLALTFDWGRPKRIKWCPVPTTDAAVCGIIAVLTSDHIVRVLEVRLREEPAIETVHHPLATLALYTEYKVHTTTFTWISTNRLALAHSDGTVSLWSIHPPVLLSRHPVCMTSIVDMASAFPSHPYTITATATNGAIRIIDLSSPSQEHTFTNSPTNCFQTNISGWSDHLQGFIIQNPSTSPGNTSLAFGHVRAFPVPRTVITGPANLICASIGAKHPFALAGYADGSVWSCNAIRKVLKDPKESLYKMEHFRHQFMPFETLEQHWKDRVLSMPEGQGHKIRATATFWQGSQPELNKSMANDGITDREMHESTQGSQPVKGSQKKRDRKNQEKEKNRRRHLERMGDGDLGEGMDLDEEEEDVQEQEQEDNTQYAPYKFVTHEPLTRVAAVAWNPNIEFAWWAVAAMGSGLVKVMDLGMREFPAEGAGEDDVEENDEEVGAGEDDE